MVTEEEMKGMQWLDQQEGKTGMMDTYVDTKINQIKPNLPK